MNIAYMKKLQARRMAIAQAKHHDYSQGIDAVAANGLVGIAVRLFDKACRVRSLVLNNSKAKVKDESIKDTLLDLANYAEYGVCLIDGQWTPKKGGRRGSKSHAD